MKRNIVITDGSGFIGSHVVGKHTKYNITMDNTECSYEDIYKNR